MEISADIYAWLTSIEALDFNTNNFTINDEGNVKLDIETTNKIHNGSFLRDVFVKLNELLNNLYGNIFKLDEKLENLENINDNAIKLKNWGLIIEFIGSYYGIKVDNDYKTLLVATDQLTFTDLFKRLYDFHLTLEEKVKRKRELEEKGVPKEKSIVERVNEKFAKEFNEDLTYDNLKVNLNTKGVSRGNQKLVPTQNLQRQGEVIDLNNQELSEFSNNLPKIRFREDYIDLSDEQPKEIIKTTSVLDFVMSIICKTMTINIKQAASLLADNRKYLNYILIKGFQSTDYKPVKKYFQEFLNNLGHYVNLIDINSIAQPTQISKNIEMSLNCLKPGLLSKNTEVVYLAGRVMSKIAYELTEKNLLASCWDWFVMPDGGLETSVMMLKKHDSTAEVCVSMIMNFSRFHLYELFSVYLRKLLDSEGAYIAFISDLLEHLSRIKYFCDEFAGTQITQLDKTWNKDQNRNAEENKQDKILNIIMANQVVSIKKSWVALIKEEVHSLNLNTRIQTCQFLGELWSFFTMYFEDSDENSNECHELLNVFKGLSRDPNNLVKYSAVTQMFRLLYQFSKERNSFARVLYKSLVFILLENNENINLKDYIINNFRQIFRLVLKIPVGTLIEPFSKQILYAQPLQSSFNLLEINFLLTVSKHPELSVKDGVRLLDILGKVYCDNCELYKALKGVFLLILARFMMNELGVEFTFKYIKFLILSYCTIEKENSVKIYSNAIRKNLNPEDYKYPERGKIELDDPVSFRVMLSKNSILEMLFDILLIKNSYVNSIAKNLLICSQMRHFKTYNFYCVGLSLVVDFYGDSQEIFHYYNKNLEELQIDKDFIGEVNKIFDRTPDVKGIPEEEILLNQGLHDDVLSMDNRSNVAGSDKDKDQQGNNNKAYPGTNNIIKNIKNPGGKGVFAGNSSIPPKPMKLKRIDSLGKRAIADINKAKEKHSVALKNKELKDEITRLKDEKFLPKNRQFSIGNEMRKFKNELTNYYDGKAQQEYNKLLQREKELLLINTGHSTDNLQANNLNTQLTQQHQDYTNRLGFGEFTNKRDMTEYLNNVNYNRLIKTEGYSNINQNLSSIPSNTHQKYQVLNYSFPILNLDDEEDCDLVELKKLIKDYSRFFRYMMHKYTGSVYQPIYGKEFTSISTVNDSISPSEIVKMFRDHEIIYKYITKDEILLFIGLLNLKVFKKATSKIGLNYNEFVEVFIQLAYYIFNRPPYNYPDYTIALYTLELIKEFSLSAEIKGNLTVEYMHPNELLTPIETEICEKLNEKILKYGATNVQLPEGYKKYLETEVNHKFKVPDCMIPVMGRSNAMCLELVDELIANALDTKVDIGLSNQNKPSSQKAAYKPGNIPSKTLTEWNLTDKCHVLEPFTKIKELYKARPGFLKLPRDKQKTKEQQEKLGVVLRGRNLSLQQKSKNKYEKRRTPEKDKIEGLNNIDYLNELNISRFRDHSGNSNKNLMNAAVLSPSKKQVKDSEVQRIFDEIEGNQSDDEFKKTIRKFLSDEFNTNNNNNNEDNNINNNNNNFNNFNSNKAIDNSKLPLYKKVSSKNNINTDDLGVVVIGNNSNNDIINNNNNNSNVINLNKAAKKNLSEKQTSNKEISNNEPNSLSLSVNNTLDQQNQLSNLNASPISREKNKMLKNNNNKENNKEEVNQKGEIINQVKLNKLVQEEAQRMEEIEKEEKRLRRMQYVKEELEKMKEKKKEKEQKRLEILSEEKKKKEAKLRKKLEAEVQLRVRIKEELDKIKRIKQQEERQKLNDLNKQKVEMAKEKLRFNEAFFNEQSEKLKKAFSRISDERKLNQQKALVDQEFEKLKNIEEKKKFNEFFEDEKKVRQVEKDLHSSITEMNYLKAMEDQVGSGEMPMSNNNNKNSNQQEFNKSVFSFNKKSHEYAIDMNSPFSKYHDHIKLIYDVYAKTLINPSNEITMDDFVKFCSNFNIQGLLLNTEDVQFIFKKIAFNPKTPHIKTLNLREFSLALVYLCLFSIDNFVNVSEQNKAIIGDPNLQKISFYQKINKHKQELINEDNIKFFFDYLEFSVPFNKKELENYINIQKSLSHLEKNMMLKNKSDALPIFNRTVRDMNHNEYTSSGNKLSGGNNNNNNNHSRNSNSHLNNTNNNYSNYINNNNNNNSLSKTSIKNNLSKEISNDSYNKNLINTNNNNKLFGSKANINDSNNNNSNNINNTNKNKLSLSKGKAKDPDQSKLLSDSSLIIK